MKVLTKSEILVSEELRDLCLRERYVKGRSSKTQAFVVLQEGVQIGLLIYEDWGLPQGFIYEIFVLREARRAGIGAWILAQAECIASELGRTSVKLTARSLDREQHSDETLITWYERRGYVRCDPGSSDMTKSLSHHFE